MERLTNYDDHMGYWSFSGDTQIEEHCDTAYAGSLIVRGEIIDRLAAYEDTGLTPEEIMAAEDRRHNCKIECLLREYNKMCVAIGNEDGIVTPEDIEHIRTLRESEADGRLIVLPCKAGETLYETIFYRHGNFVNEFTVPDIPWILENQEQIGKTIFILREEAEAALEKENECTT